MITIAWNDGGRFAKFQKIKIGGSALDLYPNNTLGLLEVTSIACIRFRTFGERLAAGTMHYVRIADTI